MGQLELHRVLTSVASISCLGAMSFLLSVEPEHHTGPLAGPPRVPSVGARGELPPKARFLRHTQRRRSLQSADQLSGTAELLLFVHLLLPVHCVSIHPPSPILSLLPDVRLPVDCVVKSGRKASDGQNTKLYNIKCLFLYCL